MTKRESEVKEERKLLRPKVGFQVLLWILQLMITCVDEATNQLPASSVHRSQPRRQGHWSMLLGWRSFVCVARIHNITLPCALIGVTFMRLWTKLSRPHLAWQQVLWLTQRGVMVARSRSVLMRRPRLTSRVFFTDNVISKVNPHHINELRI